MGTWGCCRTRQIKQSIKHAKEYTTTSNNLSILSKLVAGDEKWPQTCGNFRNDQNLMAVLIYTCITIPLVLSHITPSRTSLHVCTPCRCTCLLTYNGAVIETATNSRVPFTHGQRYVHPPSYLYMARSPQLHELYIANLAIARTVLCHAAQSECFCTCSTVWWCKWMHF